MISLPSGGTVSCISATRRLGGAAGPTGVLCARKPRLGQRAAGQGARVKEAKGIVDGHIHDGESLAACQRRAVERGTISIAAEAQARGHEALPVRGKSVEGIAAGAVL